MGRALFLQPIKGAGGDLPSIMGFVDDADEVPHYRLHETPLERYAALLLPAHLDQRYFGGIRAHVERFLDGGGTLVFNGHVAWPMLPEFATFVPLARVDLAHLAVHRLADHPVFEGVDMADLTFRRGVAGFYARGHNPPPPGAVGLIGLGPERVPCDWVYERPAGGRILMHAGNDLWMYAGADTSAARIVPQLTAWATGAAVGVAA
ncbi:hypothetical protein DLJ53_12960 [Acuticoccus sediminis]|uniref:ThuA-like domain-containing protein n=1 Tax=Acuticoccus sediminis TaxID=2184697 RepID=A0A8B2NVD3_9HYPH|nr:hypothetical protein [Acuticoccus sediminis]RAI02268.1 hypothetical protein DLJ53_12960 [Acuticoccus sediminis]